MRLACLCASQQAGCCVRNFALDRRAAAANANAVDSVSKWPLCVAANRFLRVCLPVRSEPPPSAVSSVWAASVALAQPQRRAQKAPPYLIIISAGDSRSCAPSVPSDGHFARRSIGQQAAGQSSGAFGENSKHFALGQVHSPHFNWNSRILSRLALPLGRIQSAGRLFACLRRTNARQPKYNCPPTPRIRQTTPTSNCLLSVDLANVLAGGSGRSISSRALDLGAIFSSGRRRRRRQAKTHLHVRPEPRAKIESNCRRPRALTGSSPLGGAPGVADGRRQITRRRRAFAAMAAAASH